MITYKYKDEWICIIRSKKGTVFGYSKWTRQGAVHAAMNLFKTIL